MLPNVLSHLINEGISNEDRIWVAIAGADHVYKGEQDWFYGKGQPDPVNYGMNELREAFRIIKYVSEKLGHTIVNVGNQKETNLPFARWQFSSK